MITEKDKMIIKHIEEYNFITNRQAREIFMNPDISKGYEIARRRLKVIQNSQIKFGPDNKSLIMKRNPLTNENVFFYKTLPTFHDIQIMNVYARLKFIGVEIKHFKKPAYWNNGKQRSDAFFACSLTGKDVVCFLEVCVTNNDTHIRDYENLYRIGELQEKLNGAFPRVIVVGYSGKQPETSLTVKYIQSDLSDIYNIFT